MKKRFWTAEEEITAAPGMFLFTVLWYSMLLRTVAGGGFQPMLIPFLAAGLLPLYSAVNEIRRAMFYRKQRADAIAYHHGETGRIRGVIREDVPYYSGKNRTLRYRRNYRLQVDLMDPTTGTIHTIESNGYRKPVHRYLSSDEVRVYTDRTGWKYYLEDFQLKKHKSDPGAFDQMPLEYEETAAGGQRLGQIIFIIVLIGMIGSMFFSR